MWGSVLMNALSRRLFISPEEAARVLLRAKVGYEADFGHVSLAPFRADIVSLPSSIDGAPFADELGGTEVS